MKLRSVAYAGSLLMSMQAAAQTAPASEKLEEIVVTGDRLDVIPTKPVDSVFGFGKSVLETPRSLTTISNDLLEKTIITGINDLVALTPGAFTESFFGVAGSLDVRGSPGENYFRGMRRVANPGNYPTAIGASDSIDIVRGPASPIYGPSQIGGYLNFVPKQAIDSKGDIISTETGKIQFTGGSWGKKVLNAEVGGPVNIAGKEAGYYIYGQSEDSGSYYDNTKTIQSIFQPSFVFKFNDSWRTEFGGMYQHFKGNQVPGWNRLTQDLVNHGTYIAGSAPNVSNPADGGLLTQAAANAAGLNGFYAPVFGDTPASLAAAIAGNPNLALVNPHLVHITGNQVEVSPDDDLSDDVTTLYFDVIGEFAGGFKARNKIFYELVKNNNLNAYGFSQYAKTYVAEDQFILSNEFKFDDANKIGVQVSPSVRYSGFEQGDDFSVELLDRRDITQPNSSYDHRTLAVLGQDGYSDHVRGRYVDYGFAVLADATILNNFDALVGARYDYIDVKAYNLPDIIGYATDPTLQGLAKDKKGAVSYSASLSYSAPFGLHPYVTYAKQSTLILGQGGEVPTANVQARDMVGGSNLKEIGLKATELDGHLYVAVDYFNQTRVDFNAQNTVTNNTTNAKGIEFEARWVVNPQLTVTSAYTNLKIVNLGLPGYQGVDLGAGDYQKLGIDPALTFGGEVFSFYPTSTMNPRKAGIPQQVYGLNFLASADPWVPGLSGTVAVQHVSSVPSGFTQVVTLPDYTLLNLGLRYEIGHWAINATVKNATDKQYFRSNFPDLFGSSVVLPELPRNYGLSGSYKF